MCIILRQSSRTSKKGRMKTSQKREENLWESNDIGEGILD